MGEGGELKGKVINMYLLYGYRVVKFSIEINHEQATVVRSIFADYVSGIGAAVIARRLVENNTPPMRGGQWTDKRVRELLKNEKYTGNSVLQIFCSVLIKSCGVKMGKKC